MSRSNATVLPLVSDAPLASRTTGTGTTGAHAGRVERLAAYGRFLARGFEWRGVLFSWLPLLLALLGVRILAAAYFPLFYPESRYAEMTRFLRLGYIEDPPMTSWLIYLSSMNHFLDSYLHLRISSLWLGLASYLAYSILCWRLYRDRGIASLSVLLFLSLPVINVVGVLAVPESALLCLYLVFSLCVWEALEGRGTVYWVLAGAFLGLVLLTKLAALAGMLGVGFFIALSPVDRRWLRRHEPYLALLVALLVLSPFLYWNILNGFAGIACQLWYAYTPSFELPPSGLVEFFVEQVAAAGIFLTLPLVAGLLAGVGHLSGDHRRPHLFAKVQATTVLGFFLAGSLVLETHPQTTLLAFPFLAMITAAQVFEGAWTTRCRQVRSLAGLTVGSLLLAALFIVPALGILKAMEPKDGDSKWHRKVMLAQQRLFGWREVESRLRHDLTTRFPDSEAHLFTHSSHLSTMVSFHHDGPPVVNLVPLIMKDYVSGASQRSYISSDELPGQSGIFFGDESGPTIAELANAFEEVEELDPIEVHGSRPARCYRVYLVRRLIGSILDSK